MAQVKYDYAVELEEENNLPEAIKLFNEAAAEGSLSAKAWLASSYENGTVKGIVMNKKSAIFWYTQVVEQGKNLSLEGEEGLFYDHAKQHLADLLKEEFENKSSSPAPRREESKGDRTDWSSIAP